MLPYQLKGVNMSTAQIETWSATGYHDEQREKYRADEHEAFIRLIDIVRIKLGADQQVIDDVIRTWVDGMYASEWKGWHDYGYFENGGE